MKKRLLILFTLFLILNTLPLVNAVSIDDIFTELIYNTDYCVDNCKGIYEFCNPIDKDINLNSITHKFLKENLKKEYPLMIEKTVNENYDCIIGTYLEEICNYWDNISQEVCYTTIVNNWGICNREVNKFVIMESDEEIAYNECVKLKVSGSIELNNAIDWIPEIKIDGITYTQNKWAWWNSSYTYKRLLDVCDSMNDKISLVIQIQNYIIWTYCSGEGTALYYNKNASDNIINPVVTNDTVQLPMHIILNDTLSFNPQDVYIDAGGIYHFDFDSKDSSNNSFDFTEHNFDGDENVTGKIGNAYDFDGSDDYLELANKPILEIGNRSKKNWTVHFWAWTDSSTDDQMLLSSADPFTKWWYIKLDTSADVLTLIADDTLVNAIVESPEIDTSSWYYLTYLSNSSGFYVFENGILIDSDVQAFGDCTTGLVFRVAHQVNKVYYNGILDELMIYNKSYSANEINHSYQNQINTSGFSFGIETMDTTTTTTTTTTLDTTTTTIRPDLIGGIMRILFDDLTLSEHYICFYQRVNYSDNSSGTPIEAWRENLILCFNPKSSYEYYHKKDEDWDYESILLGEDIEYVVKIEEIEQDILSNPEKMKSGFFQNIGYIISFIIILVLGIVLWKKLK